MSRAVKIDETYPDALVALGKVYEKTGEIDQAITCYEKAIQLPETNINAYFYLGIIFEKKKDYKKSIQLFK